MCSPFTLGKWIWTPNTLPNHFALFVRTVTAPTPITSLNLRVTASHSYELWIDGHWVARGPVHGDPHWCQYDELCYTLPQPARAVQVVLLAHHVDCQVISLLPTPSGGVIAEIDADGIHCGTDTDWACMTLPMWRQGVPKRGWALGYGEDYDAALEPAGWQARIFSEEVIANWPRAICIPQAESIWGGYQLRMTPPLQSRFVSPKTMTAFRAPDPGSQGVGDLSAYQDEEILIPASDTIPFELHAFNAQLQVGANAFTFDLGEEYIGHYAITLEAPAGIVIELSGAELLRDGRPWIYRKGADYTVRYRTRAGLQWFEPFFWSGFRYLHMVIRGDTAGISVQQIGCQERVAPLTPAALPALTDGPLAQIFQLCERTLQRGVQEHLIDCPTREQAQYWGDAVFIAQSLWRGFNAPCYLEWYLACFIHAPFTAEGLLSSVYPGSHQIFLDYALLPLLGQRFFFQNTGTYYQPQASLEKALHLKQWYDAHRNSRGLVEVPRGPTGDPTFIAFIDHPGLGWHNFPHRGIDRDGISCPLNLFFLLFLQILAEMAGELKDARVTTLTQEAATLADAIRQTFDDGVCLHDALIGDTRSEGTSWQTNGLAVYVGLLTGERAKRTMRAMLDGYETLCRCSPYFHFFFLPALRKVGMEAEARELIVREWMPMLEGGATLAWEGFLGDEKDSRCHPWSTAPFLYLLDETQV